jgi:dihydropteroate synthase
LKTLATSHPLTLNAGGKLISLDTPLIMGIVNTTPDSFHAPSRAMNQSEMMARIDEMMGWGADIIDVGAYSTRPGALDIPENEEINRLDTALLAIRENFPDITLSVDTYRSRVASHVIDNYGVNMINDISGGMMDPLMHEVIAQRNVAYILMHMQGTPQTMQHNPQYHNMMDEIMLFFAQQIEKLTYLGVCDIVIDPGFGFGKTMAQNFELLNRLNEFKEMGFPVLAGLSRKTMIWKTLDTTSSEALNGTTCLNTLALLKGANILRVHDVKEARECVQLVKQINHA